MPRAEDAVWWRRSVCRVSDARCAPRSRRAAPVRVGTRPRGASGARWHDKQLACRGRTGSGASLPRNSFKVFLHLHFAFVGLPGSHVRRTGRLGRRVAKRQHLPTCAAGIAVPAGSFFRPRLGHRACQVSLGQPRCVAGVRLGRQGHRRRCGAGASVLGVLTPRGGDPRPVFHVVDLFLSCCRLVVGCFSACRPGCVATRRSRARARIHAILGNDLARGPYP